LASTKALMSAGTVVWPFAVMVDSAMPLFLTIFSIVMRTRGVRPGKLADCDGKPVAIGAFPCCESVCLPCEPPPTIDNSVGVGFEYVL